MTPTQCPNCTSLVRYDWTDRCGKCGLVWATLQTTRLEPVAQPTRSSSVVAAVAVGALALTLVVTGGVYAVVSVEDPEDRQAEVAASYADYRTARALEGAPETTDPPRPMQAPLTPPTTGAPGERVAIPGCRCTAIFGEATSTNVDYVKRGNTVVTVNERRGRTRSVGVFSGERPDFIHAGLASGQLPMSVNGSDGVTVKPTRHKVNGRDYVDYEFKDKGKSYRSRSFVVGSVYVTMITLSFDPGAEEFFASFEG